MGPFWFQRGMAFLPLFLVVWTYLTFSISYIISVSRGDVDPGFPYISDTGARPPESCIFGQMLNISAVAALACLYIRYKQVTGYLDQVGVEKYTVVNRLNKFGWFLSILICLGISLVANFQETSVLDVHLVGALLAFGFGTLYAIIQTYITYKMHPEVNGRAVFYTRFGISCVAFCSLIVELISTGLIRMVDANGHVKLHWKPGDPGFSAHLASTIVEWILAFSFLAFFYTYIRDFQQITIRADTRLHQTTLYHRRGEEAREEEEEGASEA